MSAAKISTRAVTPAIGAEVFGVDLSAEMDNSTFAALHDALSAHHVLFFRDQTIGPKEQLRLAECFGPVEPMHPMFPHVDGTPQVSVLLNDAENPPFNDNWHTDVTFKQEPPMAVVLRCVESPRTGGDTVWSSMIAAYQALSPAMQEFLAGKVAVHSFVTGFSKSKLKLDDFEERKNKAAKEYPPVKHPVVRSHPVTGEKGLFVNSGFTSHIEGLLPEESEAVLHMLFAHVKRPEFHVRFQWKPNSVAIWDNRCTQHYALGDYYPERRVMHRVTIEGDRPYHVPPSQTAEGLT